MIKTRAVDVAASALLLALAALLGYDNWRTGIAWDATGPQPGYFPFYLAVILGAAALYGLARELVAWKKESAPFVNLEQLWRVAQVFFPALAFCVLMQWLGLYVASFLLIALFMYFVGRIAAWKCLATALVFSVSMFVTFDLAFDVIMPKGPVEALFGR